MEYLLVILTSETAGGRGVLIDGDPDGETSSVLAIDRGTHTVSLDGPADFTPPSQRVRLAGTDPDNPPVVFFDPT